MSPGCTGCQSGFLLSGYGGRRQLHMAADHLGDVANRHALLADPCSRAPAGAPSRASRNRCAASSRCTAGQRLDPSPGYVETPLARDVNEARDEAVITLTVNRRWEPHHRRTLAASCERQRRLSEANRSAAYDPGSGALPSVARRPGVRLASEVITSGRSDPTSASLNDAAPGCW
jgi:hypothetical protein